MCVGGWGVRAYMNLRPLEASKDQATSHKVEPFVLCLSQKYICDTL